VSNFSEKVSFIWSVADLLRGPYKPAQYGRVILPLTVLRRLDCVLEPTKAKVLEKHAALKDSRIKEPEPILNKVAGHAFHNTSKLNFQKLKGDPDKAAQNLSHYIKSFSSSPVQPHLSQVGRSHSTSRKSVRYSRCGDSRCDPHAGHCSGTPRTCWMTAEMHRPIAFSVTATAAPYIYNLWCNIRLHSRSAVLVEFVFTIGLHVLPSLMRVPGGSFESGVSQKVL